MDESLSEGGTCSVLSCVINTLLFHASFIKFRCWHVKVLSGLKLWEQRAAACGGGLSPGSTQRPVTVCVCVCVWGGTVMRTVSPWQHEIPLCCLGSSQVPEICHNEIVTKKLQRGNPTLSFTCSVNPFIISTSYRERATGGAGANHGRHRATGGGGACMSLDREEKPDWPVVEVDTQNHLAFVRYY